MAAALRLRADLWRPIAVAAICAATAASALGQSPPTRRYIEGETDRYELRVRVAGAPSELFGVSEHQVVRENGSLLERIHWMRAVETTAGDLSAVGARMNRWTSAARLRAAP